MRAKPGDLVWIVFDDVQHQNRGWSLTGNWPKRGKFIAVGYLLKSTKRSTFTIPTSSIRQVKRLVRR